jgi:hypothetical protein
MVAMLAFHPIRLKNFTSLEIGRNLTNIDGCWWIALSATETKERRPDERRIDDAITPALSKYLIKYRPVLARESRQLGALWLSSNDGQRMTYHAVADVIERTTRKVIGVCLIRTVSDRGGVKRRSPCRRQPLFGKRRSSPSRQTCHRRTLQSRIKPERSERFWSAHQARHRRIALKELRFVAIRSEPRVPSRSMSASLRKQPNLLVQQRNDANGMDRPRSRPQRLSECVGGLSAAGVPPCLASLHLPSPPPHSERTSWNPAVWRRL